MADSFDYANPSYWDERYGKQRGGKYEWYAVTWSILNETLRPFVKRESRILHLGTGNSELPRQMHEDGYHNQLAVDISGVVIDEMRERHKQLAPGLTFGVEDALNMSVSDASFDVVIEKGTLDAVGSIRDCSLSGAHPDPGCELSPPEKALMLEVFRVLRPGGLFVAIADDFAVFPELTELGRVEKVRKGERDGLPINKTIHLAFKKASVQDSQRCADTACPQDICSDGRGRRRIGDDCCACPAEAGPNRGEL